MDKRELTTLLQDPESAMHQLLTAWTDVPMLVMLDVDWDRGPLVLLGLADRMLWPLVPPGSLLQLDPKMRRIDSGSWPEFERPIYLIEHASKFYCCYAQRRGETVRLISHHESPVSPSSISIPYKEVKVRGRVKPIFRPLATRGSSAGRAQRHQPRLGKPK